MACAIEMQQVRVAPDMGAVPEQAARPGPGPPSITRRRQVPGGTGTILVSPARRKIERTW
jgi:hypothetical protein